MPLSNEMEFISEGEVVGGLDEEISAEAVRATTDGFLTVYKLAELIMSSAT